MHLPFKTRRAFDQERLSCSVFGGSLTKPLWSQGPEPRSIAAEVVEDEPLEALSSADLDQGLPKALQALRARLMDPAAAGPDDMPLRPSLRQVQAG